MKIIDLSHVLDAATPVYPGDTAVLLEKRRCLARDGYNAFLLGTGLHAGTHIDLPMHFIDDPRAVADFPPEGFIGPGVLLDCRGEDPVAMRKEYRGAVRPGDAVLIRTGFDERYGEEEYFTQHPTLSPELAEFLCERDVLLVGMDLPSPDRPPFPIHMALLGAGIPLLENLTNLGALAGAEAFEVIALPLKIGAEASLVRAVGRILQAPTSCAQG